MRDTKQRPSDRLVAHIAHSLGGRLHGAQILSRVYNTALEMMEDRGCTVIESCQSEDQLLTRIDEAKHVLRALHPTTSEAAGPRGSTLVFIDAEERTGIKLLRTLQEKHPDASLCIINADGPTPFTKKEVADSTTVEFWQVQELLINPTRHALVPRHAALSAKEVQALETDRCILHDQWPVIKAKDIIVRWYHFSRGTVVRIERTGMAHERGDYYRKVE